MRSRNYALSVSLALMLGLVGSARAQWATTYESFYLPGPFNWEFRENYQAADRLFNAFDFGHAILYETLWTKPNAPVNELEEKWYNRLTKEILVNPPRLPLEEAAVEIEYAKLVPEAKAMFDWAHLIHRQIYDVWADERLSLAQKDVEVARLIRFYKTRPDLAFSSHPKTMALMEGQSYSLAFRRHYPKFNGLIWAYHWLQVGLYEPLVIARNKDERQTGVLATVARFRQMIENPPTWMPRVMPMTAAIAPSFAARYPEAAIIFDNLHSMHDVVSDILANDSVPRDRKRPEILTAARRYRDDTSFVMTVAEWRDMAQMMGANNMGGPSVGFLPEFPTPTVERGAVMAEMDHTKLHAPSPSATRDTTKRAAAIDHSAMGHVTPPKRDSAASASATASEAATEFAMRFFADPVVRARIVSDTALLRQARALVNALPAEHRAHLEALLNEPVRPSADTTVRPPDPRAAHRAATPPKPTPKPPVKSTSTSRPKTTAKEPARSTSTSKQAASKQPTVSKAPSKTPAKSSAKDPHTGHKMPPATKRPPG